MLEAARFFCDAGPERRIIPAAAKAGDATRILREDMFSNLGRLLVHFIGAAVACTQLAYSSIRLMTPPPAPAPAPVRTVSAREPDPILLAREFGQVERVATAAIANIQVGGVFAAGRDSAAVFVVGDRPAKAVRLGQEVAPGLTLVEVDPESVTLDSAGGRRQLRVPNLPGAASSGALADFERRGNVLTAPSVDTAAAPRPASVRSAAIVLPPRTEPRFEPRPEPVPGPTGRRDVLGRPAGQ
jgi:general secretion pathway protein C